MWPVVESDVVEAGNASSSASSPESDLELEKAVFEHLDWYVRQPSPMKQPSDASSTDASAAPRIMPNKSNFQRKIEEYKAILAKSGICRKASMVSEPGDQAGLEESSEAQSKDAHHVESENPAQYVVEPPAKKVESVALHSNRKLSNAADPIGGAIAGSEDSRSTSSSTPESRSSLFSAPIPTSSSSSSAAEEGLAISSKLLVENGALKCPSYPLVSPKLYAKSTASFANVRFIQDLMHPYFCRNDTFPSPKEILVAGASPSGEYLAVGFASSLYVWKVADALTPSLSPDCGQGEYLLIFNELPCRVYPLDTMPQGLAWSKHNFLATIHKDCHDIYLWHVSKKDVVFVFKPPEDEANKEPLRGITFHPSDDSFFVTIATTQFKIWSVQEKRCTFHRVIPRFILSSVKERLVAISFDSSGNLIMGSTNLGRIIFFDFHKTRYDTQTTVPSKKGTRKGAEISSISACPLPRPGERKERYMVATTDGQIRIFESFQKNQVAFFTTSSSMASPPALQAPAFSTCPIAPHFSDDGEFIISVSNNRQNICIWNYFKRQEVPAASKTKRKSLFQSVLKRFSKNVEAMPNNFDGSYPPASINARIHEESRRQYSAPNVPNSYEFFHHDEAHFLSAFFLPARITERLMSIMRSSNPNAFLKDATSRNATTAINSQERIMVVLDTAGHVKIYLECPNIVPCYFESFSSRNLPS